MTSPLSFRSWRYGLSFLVFGFGTSTLTWSLIVALVFGETEVTGGAYPGGAKPEPKIKHAAMEPFKKGTLLGAAEPCLFGDDIISRITKTVNP